MSMTTIQGHKTAMITRYRVHVLSTPLHVGSGQVFNKWDLLFQGQTVDIVDIDALLEAMIDTPAFLDRFGRKDGTGLSDLMKELQLPSAQLPRKTSLRRLSGMANQDIVRFGIREFIRTNGRPFLPGTTLKGAIRTALWWHIVTTRHPIADNHFDSMRRINDKDIIKRVFGEEPQSDLLRCLHVSDVIFKETDLALFESRVISLTNNNTLEYKTVPNGNDMMKVPIQGLTPKCTGADHLRIKCDEWTLNHRDTGFIPNRDILPQWPAICRAYAIDFARSEAAFFAKYHRQDLHNFYEDLQRHMEEDSNGIYLHLGWGAGWCSMTGQVIGNNLLRKVREKEKMGKLLLNRAKTICPFCGSSDFKPISRKGWMQCSDPTCRNQFPANELHPVFPKSRKVVVLQRGQVVPLGWVRLEAIS